MEIWNSSEPNFTTLMFHIYKYINKYIFINIEINKNIYSESCECDTYHYDEIFFY
jgi:hypothetical protein